MSNSIDMSADMTKCPLGGDYNQLLLHWTPFFCSGCVALLRHRGYRMGLQVPGSQMLPSFPRGQDDLVRTWMQWDRCSHFWFPEEGKFEPVLEGGGGDSRKGKEDGTISQARQSRAHSPFYTQPGGAAWIAGSRTSLETQLCQDRLPLTVGVSKL